MFTINRYGVQQTVTTFTLTSYSKHIRNVTFTVKSYGKHLSHLAANILNISDTTNYFQRIEKKIRVYADSIGRNS